MAKLPWRFQGDIAYGQTDPTVTVFMGETETDEETGIVSIRQDVRNPVTMPLSELKSASHLADPKKMQEVAEGQGKARAVAREVARFAEAQAALAAQAPELDSK